MDFTSSKISRTIVDLSGTSIANLKFLQDEHSELEAEFRRERNELNRNYRQKYDPLYKKRADLLRECESTVPHFWLSAMRNLRTLAEMIQPADVPVLELLEDIRCEWKEQEATADLSSPGFSLHFVFRENNPYFGPPSELVKTYHLEESSDLTDPVLSSIETTQITWKQGKDITKKTVTRKTKNKRTKEIRKTTETVSVNSFFNFFNKHEIPTEEELETKGEDKIDELDTIIETDYETACLFRDKLIPHAIDWYTGEAEQSDDDDTWDDDEPEDSDEDDQEEEEESVEGGSEVGSRFDSKGPGKPEDQCKHQ